MADLSVQTIAPTGSSPTFAAAAGAGDTFQNSGQETVIFRTGATEAAKTVTVVAVGVCSHGSLHDLAVTVPPSGGERMIRGLDVSRFGTTVTLTYSAVTNLTVAVVR